MGIINRTYYRRHLPHFQPEGYTYFVTFRLYGSLPFEVIQKIKTDYKTEVTKIASMVSKKEKQQKHNDAKWIYFEKFDNLLTKYKTIMYFEKEEIAKIVYTAIKIRDKNIYDLLAFTIMPNHVHIVFTPEKFAIEQFSEWLPSEKMQLESGRISELDYKNVGRFAESSKLERQKESAFGRINAPLKITGQVSTYKMKDNVSGRINDSTYNVTNILQSLKKYTARECNKVMLRSGQFWQHESYDHVVRDEKELNRIIEYVLYNPVKAGYVESMDEWKWSYCKYL